MVLFECGGINTIKSLCVLVVLPMMFIYGILVKQRMMELKGKIPSQPESEASVEAQELIA